jgi:hypothetical protein
VWPGINGVVTQLDDAPTVLAEYWHTIRTECGERREPGSNLELIPMPQTDERKDVVAQNIHFDGDNSRFNVNGTDNSVNVVSQDVFTQLRETTASIADQAARTDILARIEDLEKAKGSGSFLQAYQNFMASVAAHVTVFAPFLPVLAKMLS